METACFTSLFQPNTPFTGGQNILLMQAGHLGKRLKPQRPFIPIAGVVASGSGYAPDTIANNVLFSQTFLDAFTECRQASINESLDLVGGSEYISDFYLQYLYKTTYDNAQNLLRYNNNAQLVYQFWQNANLAWTNTEYYDAINNLVNTIQQQADKAFYIPPGQYDFIVGSAFNIDMVNWETANPLFLGFLIVEFYQ